MPSITLKKCQAILAKQCDAGLEVKVVNCGISAPGQFQAQKYAQKKVSVLLSLQF